MIDTLQATQKSQKKQLSREVWQVYNNWFQAKKYHRTNWDNTCENWRFYFAKFPELGLGQWPMRVVDDMLQQERQLIQYNMIMPTIDTLAGSLMQIPFEPDFIPVNDQITSLTKAIKEAMYSDRELMDWNGPYLDLVRGGLIGGDGNIKITVSDEYNDLGNIALESLLPGALVFDPLWKTWRTKDCKIAWKETWMTAIEIAETYDNLGDYILSQAEQQQRDGTQYGEFTGIVPYKTESDTWGSAYRVIEEYRMVSTRRKIRFLLTETDNIDIPDQIPDDGIYKYLDSVVGPERWSPEYIKDKTETDKLCKLRTVCPAIVQDRYLEDGYPEVQIGCLPFKHWAATRANGEDHSIVDSIKDPQKNLNFWEAMLTHKLKTEGGGGAQFVDKSKFLDNKTYLDYCHNRNKPTKNFPVKPGVLDGGGVPALPVHKSAFPSEAYENLNHIINVIWPHISKVTPATFGRREPGQTDMSGKLYNMLKIQGDLQAFTLHYGLRMCWNEIYEAYLMQAAKTYANESVERVFPTNGGKERIVLNERVVLDNGLVGIKNDVRELKRIRHKVIISEKQASPSQNAEDIQVLSDTLKNLPEDRVLSRNFILNAIIKKMNQLPQEEKTRLEELQELELQRDIMRVRAEIAQAEAMATQAGQAPPAQNGPEMGNVNQSPPPSAQESGAELPELMAEQNQEAMPEGGLQ